MAESAPASPGGRNPLNASSWGRRFQFLETGVLAGVLALMIVLPAVNFAVYVWNAAFTSDGKGAVAGLSGVDPLVQHLVLMVSLLGAALAARQGRLLSLTAVTHFLKGRWRRLAGIFSQGLAVGVCLYLALGSWQYMETTRLAGDRLSYGIQVWWIQALMPVCFVLVAGRLAWRVSDFCSDRVWTLVLAGVVMVLGGWFPGDPGVLRWGGCVALLLAAAFGAPIFSVLGGVALVLFGTQGDPIASLALEHYKMSVNAMLPTIPLFTLAGYFLAEGGASRRLVAVFQALVGHLRGGAAVLTVLVCAFFTSFTGASGVTILALGGLLMPVLLAARFSERSALGLLTGSGSLGLLFPPCIPLILYAIVAGNIQGRIQTGGYQGGGVSVMQQTGTGAGTSGTGLESLDLENLDLESLDLGSMNPRVETPAPPSAPPALDTLDLENLDLENMNLDDLPDSVSESSPAGASDTDSAETFAPVSIEGMFLGGVGPGLLMVLLAGAWGRWQSPPPVAEGPASVVFEWGVAGRAMWAAKWELLVPVVALGTLFGGFASTVQAAALTALYALFVEVVIYRDLHWRKDLVRVMAECGVLVGGVLLILGVAQGFNNFLIIEQVPQKLLAWTRATVESPLVFLLLLNVFLLAVGCVMDIFAAIIVVVPLIVPMGLAFGIHPIQLGIIFLANLQLGYLTPPVGMNLFLAAYRFDKDLLEVYRAVLPMLGVLLVGVLLITYLPPLTLWLPQWLLGGG